MPSSRSAWLRVRAGQCPPRMASPAAAGDFSVKALTSSKLAAEMANGRLAGRTIMSMVFQDGLTGCGGILQRQGAHLLDARRGDRERPPSCQDDHVDVSSRMASPAAAGDFSIKVRTSSKLVAEMANGRLAARTILSRLFQEGLTGCGGLGSSSCREGPASRCSSSRASPQSPFARPAPQARLPA
jgi:hypothetical protein